jgi:glucosamine-6-phosphate deaminase
MKRPLLIAADTYEDLSRRAAGLIDAAIRATPAIVLALPTGGTPIGTYATLIALHRQTGTDWSQVRTFNLDEYCDVGPDDPESYAAFMQRHLFGAVNLTPERRQLPDGLAANPEAEAARYERAIDAAGGIDLAILGVGVNGHIGFNEPGDALIAETHVAALSEATWQRNFPDLARQAATNAGASHAYRRAFTMGIGTILQARRILLLASGAEKRLILEDALTGPVTTRNPASFLQLHHDVTLIVDRAAGGALLG